MDVFNDTDVEVMKKQETLESLYLFASLLVRHIHVT